MGYLVEERAFGWYSRNAAAPHAGHVTLGNVTPDLVPALLDDVRVYYGGVAVSLYIDDHAQDAALQPALKAAGAVPGPSTCYLAYAGQPPQAPLLGNATFEYASSENLREYAVAKLQGFANSEDEPAEADVASEIALRSAELAGEGRFLIARVDGKPAAIAGWYTSGVAHIFQLATRVAHRRRGIATALLQHIVREELSKGAQTVVINADEHDRPIELYRRLGFTDEVYWRRPYRVAGS
jgi:ribosomal protein S18 acetylase RimI-like enzyme